MSNPLRIGIFSPFVYRLHRGSERFTIGLANQLAADGQDVTIVTRSGPLRETHTPISPQVRVQAIPAFRYYERWWAVPFYVKLLMQRRFDVVGFFFAGYGEAEAFLLTKWMCHYKLNWFISWPASLVPHRHAEFKRYGFISHVDGRLARSEFLARDMQEHWGLDSRIITSGIDTEKFKRGTVDAEPIRAQYGIRPDEKVIVTVGALEERKGVEQVLDALPEALTQGLAIRYLIVGEGPLKATLQARIQQLGLENCVHLVGDASDVRPFYEIADLFVLMAHGEGLPNVVIEALTMELPVLVSHHPPFDDYIKPSFGVCASPESLAAEIVGLLNQPDRLRQMGRAGREHSLAVHSWPAVGAQYLDLFRSQVNGKA